MNFHQDGTLPQNGEIFVFGSNLAGRHGAGAARIAHEDYGAQYGLGVGPSGQSYAIPTKDQHIYTLPIHVVRLYIAQFIEYARFADALPAPSPIEFFVTAIGCGLAGYKHGDIAPMFKTVPDNVSLPDSWERYLK